MTANAGKPQFGAVLHAPIVPGSPSFFLSVDPPDIVLARVYVRLCDLPDAKRSRTAIVRGKFDKFPSVRVDLRLKFR